MMLRTEGDIVLASNMAQDLTNLVVAYLELYKEHAQGLNGVDVPTEPYTVIFRPMTKEGMLSVTLVYTETTTWEEPEYYDVDSDYFDERLGASNISGHTVKSESHLREYGLSIPFSLLMLPRDQMEKSVQEFAQRKRAELREQARLAEIAKHEAEIARLRAGGAA